MKKIKIKIYRWELRDGYGFGPTKHIPKSIYFCGFVKLEFDKS